MKACFVVGMWREGFDEFVGCVERAYPFDSLVSQSVIPSKKQLGGAKPFVFTEQGVSSLSAVLTSTRAVEINIEIMRAFVKFWVIGQIMRRVQYVVPTLQCHVK